jgi:hypothetical protein
MNLITYIAALLEFIDRRIVPLIFAIAFIVFLWGIFQYFIAGGADEEKRKQGRDLALTGLIGFAIMVSVWGLVNLIIGTFGFGYQTRPPLPTFEGSSASSQQPSGANPSYTDSQGNQIWTGQCKVDADCPAVNTKCIDSVCQVVH